VASGGGTGAASYTDGMGEPSLREGRVPEVSIGLCAVIVAVTAGRPRVLTIGGAPPALPSGMLDPAGDRTLERALRRWVHEQTGFDLGYVEQLYTLGDLGRGDDPAVRPVTVAYLALVREAPLSEGSEAVWRDWYGFLPWEDFRVGRPAALDSIEPALAAWAERGADRATREARRERLEIVFGLGSPVRDVERVLERYELLWEAGLVPEAGSCADPEPVGVAMAFDHRRIAAQALGRLRGKLRYRPVVFELVPETFTLRTLQTVVEALSGVRIHTQNFRRLLDRGGLVEGTGEFDTSTGGRPAELYRFRREVLRERPAPGVGLPGLRTSG
jgi:hypothetical protein